MVLSKNSEINPMTFDYTWGSLVGTISLVLITGITNPVFVDASLDIICGNTRSESYDVNVIIDKKDGS
jgi:hypothetical protein